MERRDEAAIAFFGTWMVTGLYLDGWSHIHRKPETFFTPWHGVLYSGFAVACVYFVARGVLTGQRVQVDRSVNAGFVLFAIAAGGDFAWHQIFGIERSLAALLSPTHLALMTGGILMLSGPIRSARGRTTAGFRDFMPTLVCCTLVVAVVLFFLQYASALREVGLFRGENEFVKSFTVMSVLITNVLLLGVAFFMRKNWRTPRFTFAFMFTTVAIAQAGLDGFYARHFITAFVGGIVADFLADRDGKVFGLVVPAVMWTTWVVVMAVFGQVRWDVNIWTGTIFLASLTGLGLATLLRSEPVTTASSPEPLPARDPL